MRALLFAALATLTLVGLWAWLRPAPGPMPVTLAKPAQVAVATAAPTPALRRFSLAVPGSSGTEPMRVAQGERVEITVTSAERDELHLHGYDLALELQAGQPATLTFTAEHAGRFEIELHHHHAGLGVLEVSPR